ncbi:hypothetical protein MBM_00320 [Drepanopeziza brunnea f. sp. 'multigermtubi' MB_m1]|uniref:Uncharacterized protein n=1 Tax=Marssonina brunnea f. sp. multigermtubi (strain MB_m1) TaxID=1072389 RepID=K1X818_MARBU|nr:uncharacterized protein MBM_00320 [Drepanopeziza brunnea f. sp. 'multigermtubi' MB_m1]EKD21207.1 hypothetical protein MBM_00320 [Drepanopeziza brunnea f. sp. 'multigermtubi' MB_m1]
MANTLSYLAVRQRDQTLENWKRTTARALMRALHRSVDKGERVALAHDRARSESNGKGATATQTEGHQPNRQRASARSTNLRGTSNGRPKSLLDERDDQDIPCTDHHTGARCLLHRPARRNDQDPRTTRGQVTSPVTYSPICAGAH